MDGDLFLKPLNLLLPVTLWLSTDCSASFTHKQQSDDISTPSQLFFSKNNSYNSLVSNLELIKNRETSLFECLS